MAIFRFKLSVLHRLKTQLEDQAKHRFGKAVAILNAELKKLNAINAAIESALEDIRTVSVKRFTAGKIREFNYYIAAMKQKAREQKKAVDAAAQNVNRAREALILAARQREMYDKLREKAYARYVSEEKRLENRGVDELVSYRSSLRGQTSGK